MSISFIEGIYSVRDAGGGIQEYNLPKLLKLDDTSIFCKEKCGKIMFSEDNYPFLTEKGSTIYTLQCVCKDGRTMNFDKDSLEKIWDSRES